MKKQKPFIALGILPIFMCLCSCGGNSSGGAQKPGPIPIASASKLIGTAGGTLELEGRETSINIPAGTFRVETRVELAVYKAKDFPVGQLLDETATPLSMEFDASALTDRKTIQVTCKVHDPESQDRLVALSTGSGLALPIDPIPGSVNNFLITSADVNFLSNRQETDKRLYLGVAEGSDTPKAIQNSVMSLYKWQKMGNAETYLAQNQDNLGDEPSRDLWGTAIDPETESPNPNGRVAIVVHGMNNNVNNMSSLAAFVASCKLDSKNLYDEIYGVSYDWADNIRDNGNRLAKIVYELKKTRPSLLVDIYGHSMGGLVARWAIEKGELSFFGGTDGLGSSVERLFTFGTPHFGVPEKAIRALALNTKTSQFLFWGVKRLTFSVFAGIKDLMREKPFIQWLNDGHTSANGTPRRYIALGGTSKDYQGDVGIVVQYVYEQESPEDIPHDGIVPLRSARYDHLSLLTPGTLYPPTRNVNHSDIRGIYSSDEKFNLDSGTFHEKLRGYVMDIGKGDVIIK